MKVSNNPPDKSPARLPRINRPRLWMTLVVVLYTLGLLLAGMLLRPRLFTALETTGLMGASDQPSLSAALRNGTTALLDAPGNYLAAITAPAPPHLQIDIKFKHLNKIYNKREEALRRGQLIQGEDDFVPAAILYEGKSLPVKMRLKGDYTDHLQGDKWSFRVHLKDDDTLFGMRRFSLEAPWTRGYQSEMLVHETMRRQGILAPRFRLVDVTMNGRNIGLMTLEEHPATEMLSAGNKPDGVILKFDESLHWQALAKGIPAAGVYNNYRTATLDSFESNRVMADPALRQNYYQAVGLMRGFISGKLPASEVFDARLLGRFLAVAELWDAWHMLLWNNLRFYYNPETQRLEPVAFDAGANHPNHSTGLLAPNRYPLQRRMFEDPNVRKHYVEALNRLGQSVLDGKYIQQVRKDEAPLLTALNREFPLLRPFALSRMQERARQFVRLSEDNFASYTQYPFAGKAVEYPALLHAYLVQQGGETWLELLPLPDETIVIDRISWISGHGERIPVRDTPLTLNGTPFDAVPDPYRIRLHPQQGTLQVEAHLQADPGQQKTVIAKPYAPTLPERTR